MTKIAHVILSYMVMTYVCQLLDRTKRTGNKCYILPILPHCPTTASVYQHNHVIIFTVHPLCLFKIILVMKMKLNLQVRKGFKCL